MSWVNNHTPPPAQDLRGYYGPEPYDVNFVFPLHLRTLESARVRLTPFIPAQHAQAYLDAVTAHPSLERWTPLNHRTLDDVLRTIETWVRADPGWVLLAIVDKPSGAFAGVIGLIKTSAPQLTTEIGWVIVFPAFQRTYVASNAVGVLLRYCLELPTAEPPGLGLRRVIWTANPFNTQSARTAQRMGFKLEGTLRWSWVLGEGKEGKKPRAGDPFEDRPGRDSVLLAFCGDDWEDGGRELVQKRIDRV
ncbi:acyl-CoA N-acyltransferase [Auriscalpium vulgare]|uniref:Acyl-CoA N-acyltransferase n=1 Tax=Auriscalpium vulgare TaxID=40419 RepID=A0ACB8RHP7_9AGAM|nr:acyl-CoA N-acyltransferase [Auriscalpium vulgare]